MTISREYLPDSAAPVVLETDAAIRSIVAHCKDETELYTIGCVYRMLLLGAVGVLKQAGQPMELIAHDLRLYADQLSREAKQ